MANNSTIEYEYYYGMWRGQRRIRGAAIGAKPPLNQWNLLISGGFQAPTGAELPPPWKEKNLSPSWTNSWICPCYCPAAIIILHIRPTTELFIFFIIWGLDKVMTISGLCGWWARGPSAVARKGARGPGGPQFHKAAVKVKPRASRSDDIADLRRSKVTALIWESLNTSRHLFSEIFD